MSGNLVQLSDVLAEGTDGQYVELDLVDGDGVPLNTANITAITGTLRSRDTGLVVFGGASPETLYPGRATFPGELGRVRVTFSAADLASSGARELQTRSLTMRVDHTSGLWLHCAVVFLLRNLSDVPEAVRA